jgi:N-acyl-L-homoserine lactone synthetase
MIIVVSHEDQRYFQPQMKEMFQDRKRLFVDLMKWEVPVVDEIYEKDDFDTPDAIYLIALDPHSFAHLGSLRLIPTTRPHLLGRVFPHLCDGAPPVGEAIWEVTRLCTARGLKTGQRRDVRHQLMTAMVEFGLLYGVSSYLCVVYAGLLSQLLAMGWEVTPLGLPQPVAGGEWAGAHRLSVRPATLELFRQQWDLRSPVLTFNPRSRAA